MKMQRIIAATLLALLSGAAAQSQAAEVEPEAETDGAAELINERLAERQDRRQRSRDDVVMAMALHEAALLEEVESIEEEALENADIAEKRRAAVQASQAFRDGINQNAQVKEMRARAAELDKEIRDFERPQTREGWRDIMRERRELYRERMEVLQAVDETIQTDAELKKLKEAADTAWTAFLNAYRQHLQQNEEYVALLEQLEVMDDLIDARRDTRRAQRAQEAAGDRRRGWGRGNRERQPREDQEDDEEAGGVDAF